MSGKEQASDKVELLLAVEGPGDQEAARLLVRRLLQERFGVWRADIEVHVRRDVKHLRANGWENFRRYYEVAKKYKRPIVWMVDVDDECPVDVARAMVGVAKNAGIDQPFGVCLWEREFETMFLYQVDAIAAKFGLDGVPESPECPTGVRGAKEWIDNQLPRGWAYKETTDQAGLVGWLELDRIVDGCPCANRLSRCLGWMLGDRDSDVFPAHFADKDR